MNNATTDFPSSSRQESFDNFRPSVTVTATAGANDSSAGPSGFPEISRRRKRKKMCRLAADPKDSPLQHPKTWKKPDLSAPKIARPCSECGKQFSSWKALFGHMRCHPERTWRGINPPLNSRRPPSEIPSESSLSRNFTEEDHEVATCLVLLSMDTTCSVVDRGYRDCNEALVSEDVDGIASPSGLNCRFECSSCKRIFGSHQALGGHRASHKNVKGCFAIARSDGEDDCLQIGDHGHDRSTGAGELDIALGHQSRMCMRVFSNSQSPGGHRRLNLNPSTKREDCGDLDLNSPAPLENDGSSSSSSSSSGLILDLRLGM